VLLGWQVVNWVYRDNINQIDAPLWQESEGIKGLAVNLIRDSDIPREQKNNLFVLRTRAWLRELHPEVVLLQGNMTPVERNGAFAHWELSYQLSGKEQSVNIQGCLDTDGMTVDCAGSAQSPQTMPDLPDIAYDDLGFMTVKVAPEPPLIDEATAVVIADEWLVDRWGIEKGGAIAAGVSATRFILFSQEPAIIVDKPTWVIKYNLEGSLQRKVPCGGLSKEYYRCVYNKLYVLVDPERQEAFQFVQPGTTEQ
jgi:hypothetical protein